MPALPAHVDRRLRLRVLLLGMLAFLLLLSEGSAMDWSSLHAREHLGASAPSAALAIGSFVVAMTVARFATDRVAQAVGPVWVLRGGSILAAAGILAVIIAPNLPVALAVLKLPTGAITAFLGLLLMRGQFVPGLSALDTSAQILAWALVFGYAQQLFTRLVDRQGQTVLDSVRGADKQKPDMTPP